MEVFSVVALAALTVKLTSLSKYIRARQFGDALTQIYVLALGVLLAWLAAQSSAMENVEINGTTFGSLDGASVVLVGIALAATASFAFDYKKARDNSDTSVEPALLPGANKAVPPTTAKPC